MIFFFLLFLLVSFFLSLSFLLLFPLIKPVSNDCDLIFCRMVLYINIIYLFESSDISKDCKQCQQKAKYKIKCQTHPKNAEPVTWHIIFILIPIKALRLNAFFFNLVLSQLESKFNLNNCKCQLLLTANNKNHIF